MRKLATVVVNPATDKFITRIALGSIPSLQMQGTNIFLSWLPQGIFVLALREWSDMEPIFPKGLTNEAIGYIDQRRWSATMSSLRTQVAHISERSQFQRSHL
jgi:hypothetical protein